jgi:predicted homoserine dehydrogenase-like protein
MFKPFHLIGLELNVSILSAALDGRPTGATRGWRGDVVATAKRDLKAGETLDGEGGETVWGKLVPAQRSSAERLCPIGMAQDVRLLRDVPRGAVVRLADVALAADDPLLALRAAMTPDA